MRKPLRNQDRAASAFQGKWTHFEPQPRKHGHFVKRQAAECSVVVLSGNFGRYVVVGHGYAFAGDRWVPDSHSHRVER